MLFLYCYSCYFNGCLETLQWGVTVVMKCEKMLGENCSTDSDEGFGKWFNNTWLHLGVLRNLISAYKMLCSFKMKAWDIIRERLLRRLSLRWMSSEVSDLMSWCLLSMRQSLPRDGQHHWGAQTACIQADDKSEGEKMEGLDLLEENLDLWSWEITKISISP